MKMFRIQFTNSVNVKAIRGCKLNCVKFKNNRTLTHGLRNEK